MKKIISFLLCVLLSLCTGLVFSGCGGTAKETGKTFTYKDQSVTVKAMPQRVVTLSTPLLNMAYAVGGSSVARATTKSPLPDAAKDLPELGQVSRIDMEKLVSLSPDLVIGEKMQNKKLESLLQSNQIPYLLINYDGINDNVPLLKFFGEIYGKETEAAAAIDTYEKRISEIKAEAAKHKPARIAILRATGKDVTAETPISVCASMAAELGLDNVITLHKEMNLADKTVPYSLEQLTADNPDIIFIVTMGRASEINKKLDEEMRSNPAWSGLKAVTGNRVHFLPYDLFLLNPGLRTPEAMEQLLELAYGK